MLDSSSVVTSDLDNKLSFVEVWPESVPSASVESAGGQHLGGGDSIKLKLFSPFWASLASLQTVCLRWRYSRIESCNKRKINGV